MIGTFSDDIRYSLRGLGRDPILAIAATAILALCIGANTTVFSLVNSILIRPLPYSDSERIYWISDRVGRTQMEVGAAPDYFLLRKWNQAFEDVAAYNSTTLNWSGLDKPEQVDAAQVTPSFFRVLGTQPLMGRYLAPEEQGSNAPAVVVLSYAFWRNRFGSDPKIVGKTITLDQLPRTIIGVMPQGYDYPRGAQMPIWMPLAMDESSQLPILPTRPMRIVNIIARRRMAVTPTELETEMRRLSNAIALEYPKEFRTDVFRGSLNISAIPLQEHTTGDLRPALLVLSGAVGLVLLIACFNLASLLVSRASGRQRELAIRLALGSNRRGIIRQMITESVVLALPGGVIGALLAWLAVALLNAAKPLVLVKYPPVVLDIRTLAFAFALTLLTGLLFGTAPAFTAGKINIHDSLKSGGQMHSGGARTARLRQILVVAELAISLVLLIGAGLLARSFSKLANRELGFPADHLLTFRVNLVRSRYATPAAQRRFYDELVERIKQLPMVRDAALSADIPLGGEYGFNMVMGFQIPGQPLPQGRRPQSAVAVVNRDFFRTMGIPLQSGRTFNSEDTDSSDDHVVVNEAFARKILAGEDPIGKRLEIGPDNRLYGTIIGVVGNIRSSSLGADPGPLVYNCDCQNGGTRVLTRMALVIRTNGDPQAAIPAVESQVYAVDREQPVFDMRTMEERLANSLAPQRSQLIVIGAFAAIALILAAAGVYAVMSYLVTRRTREIGVRMALGARPQDVLGLVVGESITLVVVAISVGLVGAWSLTRYVQFLLYGITPLDGPTFGLTSILLSFIVLLASLGPARRASQMDPMKALREE